MIDDIQHRGGLRVHLHVEQIYGNYFVKTISSGQVCPSAPSWTPVRLAGGAAKLRTGPKQH
eukprot:5183334-Pyramimonas_sp.AAC.1